MNDDELRELVAKWRGYEIAEAKTLRWRSWNFHWWKVAFWRGPEPYDIGASDAILEAADELAAILDKRGERI